MTVSRADVAPAERSSQRSLLVPKYYVNGVLALRMVSFATPVPPRTVAAAEVDREPASLGRVAIVDSRAGRRGTPKASTAGGTMHPNLRSPSNLTTDEATIRSGVADLSAALLADALGLGIQGDQAVGRQPPGEPASIR